MSLETNTASLTQQQLLERIAALEAKLAQRGKDDELAAIVLGSWGHLKLMMGASSWRGRVELSDVLANIDEFSAAPAAPEQQDHSEQHLDMVAQAPNAQQAELPPGWKTVVVPEDVGPEPDWEDVRYQAETATGIELPRAVFSIVIREVRRWMAAQQAEAQEPCAYIRRDQLQKAAQAAHLCEVTPEPRQDRVAIFTRPQPAQLQRLSEEEVMQHNPGPKAFFDGQWKEIVEGIQSALAAKNGVNLK